MYIYEGEVYLLDNDMFMAVVFKVDHDEPGYDPVMERVCENKEEATIWVDDEISRLVSGHGVWE